MIGTNVDRRNATDRRMGDDRRLRVCQFERRNKRLGRRSTDV